MRIDASPSISESIAPLGEPTVSAAIDYVETEINGLSSNVSLAFVQRVSSTLRRSELFLAVYEPELAPAAPADSVRIGLHVTEDQDAHEGTIQGIAMLLVATAFLAGPFLRVPYDHSLELRAVATLPGGAQRTYESSARGRVEYGVLVPDREMRDSLQAHVTEQALAGLVEGLRGDPQLLRALQLREERETAPQLQRTP